MTSSSGHSIVNTPNLTTRITEYVLKRTGTTLSQLESVVVSKGFTIDELYTALETVHRDKRIARKVLKGEIVYAPAPEPKAIGSHVTWCRENYPDPDPWCVDEQGNFIEAFPDIDMSFMFLKTKEERDEYKAAASGRPIYMLKKNMVKKNMVKKNQYAKKRV
jgi:hypothetical protein